MKKYLLLLFFLLTFVLTWTMWLPAALTKLNGGVPALGPDNPIGQFGRWAPGLIAIILTSLIAGKQGLGALFRPLKIWRVHPGWYLFALLFQPALFFASKWIDFSLLGRSYEIISPLASANIEAPFIFIAVGVIISAIPGSFMEELGWRGFALSRLQNKNNALIASIVLGLSWGAWHIPAIMYLEGTDVLNIIWAVLNTISVTILFTWIFNNTQGSLLLVTLFHMSIQYSENFLGIIPTQTPQLLKWLVVIIVVVVASVENLSKSGKRIQLEGN
jgi:membrane protease YdiL (CAAX protease family)